MQAFGGAGHSTRVTSRPGDVVDIFCLLGRVLVVVFARVFFISPDYKYSQCRKVSEYQFHITANTANFFISQKSKKVNLPILAVLGGFCMAGSRDVFNFFISPDDRYSQRRKSR